MGESFRQKENLLQYTMTLLQGPKDPVLPTLPYIAFQDLICILQLSIDRLEKN